MNKRPFIKKSDDNYRDIHLLNITLKLTIRIIVIRINKSGKEEHTMSLGIGVFLCDLRSPHKRPTENNSD